MNKQGRPDADNAAGLLACAGKRLCAGQKGKHAFFVVSHSDRPHPHVHIYYNSTTLDCTRKFRDFLGSGRAFRRLSDRVWASTLGKGYGPEDIQAVIGGRASMPEGRAVATRKVNLIVDIQAKMRAGKGPAYQKWATIYNLKAMAAALQYLQENGLMDYEQLERRAAEATGRFHSL